MKKYVNLYSAAVREYLQSFYTKDIAFLEDIVNEYNRNKIFPDMDDMIVLKPDSTGPKYRGYGEKSISEIEHSKYLIKHGLITDNEEINLDDDYETLL